MNTPLASLLPTSLWKHFYRLTQIPRPSGQMEAVTAFVENFGKELGLETRRDSQNNICIVKPATEGYEHVPTIILQSHLDMVPQANDDTTFDFAKEPIQAYVDGDWVKARGTTLGADNGIGVAGMMAVLEATHLRHGRLEALFTTDEETGMYGAKAIRPGFVTGKILLNLDSEKQGDLYIGCAGGVDITTVFKYAGEYLPEGSPIARIALTGLRGGHSGLDIHLGCGNANKLLFRFLKEIAGKFHYRLLSVQGGTLRNAIPREAFALVALDNRKTVEALQQQADTYLQRLKQEYADIEQVDKLQLTVSEEPWDKHCIMPQETQEALIHAVCASPNNEINRFATMPDTVETSLNLAVVKTVADGVIIQYLARSSSESRKEEICSSLESLYRLAGADSVETGNGYPGWEPNEDSPILDVAKNTYRTLYGELPEVKVMHAGLECGIILDQLPDLDIVSFGPTIQYPHSPGEQVEIASVERFWNFLTSILNDSTIN